MPPESGTGTILYLHVTPGGLGGSEVTMRAEIAGMKAAGWTVFLAHEGREPLPKSLEREVDRAFEVPGMFDRYPQPGPARRIRGLIRSATADAPSTLVAHIHLEYPPLLVAMLARALPTVLTAHVPVCPNGARYRYTAQRACDWPISSRCLTHGYRLEGCGHTVDAHATSAISFAGAAVLSRGTVAALRRCSAVIAPSNWQRDRLVADGVPAESVHVIPPPSETRATDPTKPALAPPVVLAMGRLVVVKGFHHLLDASARTNVPHTVAIAGEGPALEQLQARARQLAIDDRVTFLGRLSRREVAEAYGTAAVVAVPSLWPETFGMVGPEALSRGCKVVAYGQAGILDWGSNDERVHLARPGDVGDLAACLGDALRASAERCEVIPRPKAGISAPWSDSKHLTAVTDVYHHAIRQWRPYASPTFVERSFPTPTAPR